MPRKSRIPQKRLNGEPTKEGKLPITKLDAARRQLETAVRLWFHDGDPVSVHTLTMAAHEILRVINKSRNGPPMFGEPSPYIRSEYTDAWRQLSLKSFQFFKHASRDAHETHYFPPDVNSFIILDASETYHALTNDIRPLFKLFKWYMRAHFPDLFLEPPQDWRMQKSWTKQRFFSELIGLAEAPEAMESEIRRLRSELGKSF